MSAVFLSASIPVPGRKHFFETANPFLIQASVREFVWTVLGRRKLIWGGHPSITPMIWAVCADLGLDYAKTVKLYQSRYFEGRFPPENTEFANVELTPNIQDSLDLSLTEMRRRMIGGNKFEAAIFIGGMEGIFEEHEMFRQAHPDARVILVKPPGGATLDLVPAEEKDKDRRSPKAFGGPMDYDFNRLFHDLLKIRPNEERSSGLT
ncbi:SLOG domain-containing protein [Ferrovibrio xuzhouensis]|uniref:Uncharacterized protein n=1 Tax=Ferrovibrio xuzhouensis TaxID=1576914 RepID=A0ABV7VLX6_9PROT